MLTLTSSNFFSKTVDLDHEMTELQNQLSASLGDLSVTVENEMEIIFNEVLLQPSLSVVVDKDTSDEDDLKQPIPSSYTKPDEQQYTDKSPILQQDMHKTKSASPRLFPIKKIIPMTLSTPYTNMNHNHDPHQLSPIQKATKRKVLQIKHDLVQSDSVGGMSHAPSVPITKFHAPYQYKWWKLLCDIHFCSRLMILFLSVIILFLCITYCVGQTVQVKLELIKDCYPKTREEIWYNHI